MEICIKCKKELPEGALYCPACGKKQERTPRKHKKRANGTGNISVLPGNRAKKYMARRSGELIGTYTTYAEAQKALDRLADVDISDKYNMTFAQVYAAWAPEHSRESSPAWVTILHHIKIVKNCMIVNFVICGNLTICQ